MVWTAQDWGTFFGSLTALLGTVGALLFTYYRTKSRGPEFVIIDLRISNYDEVTPERNKELKEPHMAHLIYFTLLNTGDRIGILKLNSNELFLNDTQNPFKDPEPYWTIPLLIDGNTNHAYNYYIPLDCKDWTEGRLVLKGYYYDHKGYYNKFEKEFKGKNQLNSIWKLQMSKRNLFWMKVRYYSKLKRIKT